MAEDRFSPQQRQMLATALIRAVRSNWGVFLKGENGSTVPKVSAFAKFFGVDDEASGMVRAELVRLGSPELLKNAGMFKEAAHALLKGSKDRRPCAESAINTLVDGGYHEDALELAISHGYVYIARKILEKNPGFEPKVLEWAKGWLGEPMPPDSGRDDHDSGTVTPFSIVRGKRRTINRAGMEKAANAYLSLKMWGEAREILLHTDPKRAMSCALELLDEAEAAKTAEQLSWGGHHSLAGEGFEALHKKTKKTEYAEKAGAAYFAAEEYTKAGEMYRKARMPAEAGRSFVQAEGHFRDAAEAFDEARMHMEAARCWMKGNYPSDHVNAAASFEKAGAYFEAAEARLITLDYEKAYLMFVESGKLAEGAKRVAEHVAGTPKTRCPFAAKLYAKAGLHREAGSAWMEAGEFKNAAECFMKAGCRHQAAEALVLAGEFREALAGLELIRPINA